MNNFILGTMNIDYPHSSNTNATTEYYQSIIDKYISQTKDPILDTAYYYGNTKTEQILGEILPYLSRQPKIATKANPWFENDFTNGKLGQLSKTNLERQLTISLRNLKKDKVDIFYLHCPDYETPFSETLETTDELWRKEKFDYLGISNFSIDQVKELFHICESTGYNRPKYYQGMYNIICRKVEEIFPIVEEHDMIFWGYNPLAGGLLTGKYKDGIPSESTRFTNNQIYQNIFWKPEIIDPLHDFFKSPDCISESLQWLFHHSKIRQNNDKIIMGVSTLEQLENNIQIISKNHNYTNEKMQVLNNIYTKISDASPNYYY
jgi:aflatoxin B1 aldehyde reductase